jgi:hypothetical protein
VNALWRIPLLAAVGLALAMFALAMGDSTVFVPAPETVASSFLNDWSLGRYSQCLSYLTPQRSAQSAMQALERANHRFKNRYGQIVSIDAERGPIRAGRAEAAATIETRDSRRPIRRKIRLIRMHGVWRISDFAFLFPSAEERSGAGSRGGDSALGDSALGDSA